VVTPQREPDAPINSADNSPLHPVELSATELLRQCDVRKTKRSGPGGQHRNKVETAIVLTHQPTGIQAEASERRSQSENLAIAVERLRIRLAVRVRSDVPTSSPPSELWRSRCKGEKIVISPSHSDFPRLLVEALDRIAAVGWDLKPAAEQLGCSPSQLLKLIKDEPTAWGLLQEERRRSGLHPLK